MALLAYSNVIRFLTCSFCNGYIKAADTASNSMQQELSSADYPLKVEQRDLQGADQLRLRDHGFDLIEAPDSARRAFSCGSITTRPQSKRRRDGGVKIFAYPGYADYSSEISKLVQSRLPTNFHKDKQDQREVPRFTAGST